MKLNTISNYISDAFLSFVKSFLMMNTTYTEDANTNPNQAVIRISEATQYDYEKDEIRRAVTYERGPFGFIDNSTLGDNVETDASKVGGHLTIIEGTVNLNCMAITLEEAENLSNILAMVIFCMVVYPICLGVLGYCKLKRVKK